MKKITKILINRLFFIILILIMYIISFNIMLFKFSNYFIYFYIINFLISLLVLIHIINNKSNPSYKISWMFTIFLFSIYGCLLYLLLSSNHLNNRSRNKMNMIKDKIRVINIPKNNIREKLKKENMVAFKQSSYIRKYSLTSIYDNIYTEYYSTGEKIYIQLKEELLKAKHYIFLEFFTIEEGVMWNSILDILVEKVKEGVEVRVMYDDIGSFRTLPAKYNKKLEDLGIKTCVFNPSIPVLALGINNRDHRKIVVIDGCVGFTGGINLTDEYINVKHKYGHWKDGGIMLKGIVVKDLTKSFLLLWNWLSKIEDSYEKYLFINDIEEYINSSGYVQIYDNNPFSNETVSKNIYLNLINNANKYIYITTPYLIIDNEIINSLILASKSGIDVRIITPGIPDKKIVNELTKSYYEILIENGVKIFEYTKGFIHAKNVIVDDIYASLGTINLDYRSLYFNFEYGVWMYKTDTIFDIKKDFEQIFNECYQVTLKDCSKVSKLKKIFRSILKIFAPLM